MSGCNAFGFKPPKDPLPETELYECDGCSLIGEAFEFELADEGGQLCEECVLESF